MTRRVPPVHSPVSWRGLRAAWRTALGGDADAARSALAGTLRAAYDADIAVLTDSGTTALSVAITAALASVPGAPVALPAYGCYDLATAADAANVPVVLYDVEPATLAPRWDTVEQALSAGARAVVVAHLYGYPVDMPRALALAGAAGAVVIEDAAQGAGARLAGRLAGTFGPLTVLSFGRGKGMTGGGGGALLGRGSGVDSVERALRRLGHAPAPWRSVVALTAQRLLAHPTLYGLPAALPWLRLGETVYHAPWPPRGMPGAAAAAAGHAFALADTEGAIRRLHAGALEAAARAGSVVQPVTPVSSADPGYLRLAGCLAPGASLPRGARRMGVGPGYPRALADLEGFRERLVGAPSADGARELAARLVTVPTHGLLQPRDRAELEAWLRC